MNFAIRPTTAAYVDIISNFIGKLREARPLAPATDHQLLALEPRMVFDGAGLSTFAELHEVVSKHVTDASAKNVATRDLLGALQSRAVGQDAAANIDVRHAAAANAPATNASTQIVFIESNVPDISLLLTGLPSDAQVYILNSNGNGMDQMAAILAGRSDISAIHIIAHGTEANLSLGTADLNAQSMTSVYAHDLAVIGSALVPNGDILL